jgi:hypothetical protein
MNNNIAILYPLDPQSRPRVFEKTVLNVFREVFITLLMFLLLILLLPRLESRISLALIGFPFVQCLILLAVLIQKLEIIHRVLI